ncbi:MAG: pilin [Selenomonadaceae bacterium]|nr:pilin [Selenomonadaceae bacterium]
MLKKIKEFLKEKGQGVVEYALILGFIAVIAVGLLNYAGIKGGVDQNINNMSETLSAVTAAYSSPVLTNE